MHVATKKEIYMKWNNMRISFIYEVFYIDISLLIGSTSNYAGDGPTERVNSLDFNGFKVSKNGFRYYITHINETVLQTRFPHNNIHVGDEAIQLNGMYCQHIQNVAKYIETTDVNCISLKSTSTQIFFTEKRQQETTTPVTQVTKSPTSNNALAESPTAFSILNSVKRKRNNGMCYLLTADISMT